MDRTDDHPSSVFAYSTVSGTIMEQSLLRLHPSSYYYTSKLFYESKLTPKEGLEQQVLTGPTNYLGAGLRVEAVEHEGNQNSSEEEVEKVADVVADLLQGTWTDMDGETHLSKLRDILVVAPYNSQVRTCRRDCRPEREWER